MSIDESDGHREEMKVRIFVWAVLACVIAVIVKLIIFDHNWSDAIKIAAGYCAGYGAVVFLFKRLRG